MQRRMLPSGSGHGSNGMSLSFRPEPPGLDTTKAGPARGDRRALSSGTCPGRETEVMKRRSFTIACALAFSGPVLAQQGGAPQRYYARAYYTKWKPGMQAEGQAFLKDVPYKASLNWLKSEPSAVGQITMSRVLPGGSEISHDRLRLVVMSAPPDLSGRGSPGGAQHVESLGMSHAAYTAKLGSLMDNIRSEIWRSVYRHGSIQAGDYVRVLQFRVPGEMRPARLALLQNWESAMRAQIVKSGVTRAMESWTVWNGAEEDAYSVSLAVYPDSESAFKSFGGQQEVFLKAHPGKDYHTYREAYDAVGRAATSVSSVVYRVDLAAWK